MKDYMCEVEYRDNNERNYTYNVVIKHTSVHDAARLSEQMFYSNFGRAKYELIAMHIIPLMREGNKDAVST